MPEKKSDRTGPDMPPSTKSDIERWKDQIERKSRAIDKELGFEVVNKENADEWLDARMKRFEQEDRQRSEASWVQLQAGLDFQRKMRRGTLPCTKGTMTTRAARQRSPPDQQDKTEPSIISRPDSAAKSQACRRSTRSSPPIQADADTPDADAPNACGDLQQIAKRRNSVRQSKEVVTKQEDSTGQAQSKKRPRANPLESNLGPSWDFHFAVDGSRPTKFRGNGYKT